MATRFKAALGFIVLDPGNGSSPHNIYRAFADVLPIGKNRVSVGISVASFLVYETRARSLGVNRRGGHGGASLADDSHEQGL